VTLSEELGEMRLTISDRGVGFDVSRLQTIPGLGLTSIQERARMIGAALEIRSTSASGTTVDLRVPTSTLGV
jgi:signal transduction histidine kinase